LAGISFSAFAQSDLRDVQNGVMAFSEDLAKALPFNSALGLNWSDAYIGKVTDGHFGAGISVGVTTMGMSSIQRLVTSFGTDISLDWNKMPIPAYAIEGRVGGFFLPFDIGLKFGILPSINMFGISLDYLQVGGDLRYAILDGIDNPELPNVSLGFGVSYLKGGIVTSADTSQTISFGNNDSIRLGDAAVNLEWNTVSLDLKAQISKTFAIVTPYLGLGGSYAFSSAGYSVDAPITMNGQPITQADINTINSYLRDYGLEEVDVSADGISSILKINDFSFRGFGGLSLNLAAFRLDLTGLYSLLDGNFGGSVGLRFQL
jgi:hypothetical protein